MESVVLTIVSLFFLVGFLFTIVGALDPSGDPVGWLEDKFASAKRLLNR